MNALRKQVFSVLEGWGRADALGRGVDIALIALIVVNVLAVTLETLEGWPGPYRPWFDWLERISVAIFTVEYLTRLWVAAEDPGPRGLRGAWRRRLAYMTRPIALIDLAAILPFYLTMMGMIPPADGRALRAIRMLRVLKLTRYSVALQSIVAVFHSERRTMLAALVIVFIALHLSATAIYLVEHEAQPEKFSSIPEALWWALATLTTVGYGDVVPITPWGRAIGAVVMLLGIGLFGLWTGLFASSFLDELRRRDFKVTGQMVSQVPAFAGLSADQLHNAVRLLSPLVLPGRYLVTRAGERAEAMYFVVSGEVELEVAPKPLRVGPGGFFGEYGLLHGPVRRTTAVTLLETRLLSLDRQSFDRLAMDYPEVAGKIREKARQRADSLNAADALE
ncbi:ion transporter [Marivibrio halodurans]|uniref:Ion transporter n=1 Tax=Marivibrio halodurans TaxID=2039722 RepID=A0A8J7RZP8_9PROT|nr:cyclic nucleotide-gated ion channel [Marivibrio halodurans]MBP5856019.1 ion transporter [Marivibrio halodurans]